MAERDPYAVVGVPVHASPDAVAAACRDLARRHHPDVSPEPDAQAHMAAINEACSILRNPVRRAAWDRINLRILDRPRQPAAGGTTTPRPDDGRPGAPSASTGPVAWRRGPSARVRPARRRVPGEDRCSRSAATSGGPWARSHASTPATSSGSGTASEGEPYRVEIAQLLRAMYPTSTEAPAPALTVASRSAEPPRTVPRRPMPPRPVIPRRRRLHLREERGDPVERRPRGPAAAHGPASATSRGVPAPASASRPRGGRSGRTGPRSPSSSSVGTAIRGQWAVRASAVSGAPGRCSG